MQHGLAEKAQPKEIVYSLLKPEIRIVTIFGQRHPERDPNAPDRDALSEKGFLQLTATREPGGPLHAIDFHAYYCSLKKRSQQHAHHIAGPNGHRIRTVAGLYYVFNSEYVEWLETEGARMFGNTKTTIAEHRTALPEAAAKAVIPHAQAILESIALDAAHQLPDLKVINVLAATHGLVLEYALGLEEQESIGQLKHGEVLRFDYEVNTATNAARLHHYQYLPFKG